MPAGIHIDLESEAPSWAQALLYSACVFVVVLLLSMCALFVATESAVILLATSLPVAAIVASVYFVWSRRCVEVIEDYTQAAAASLSLQVPQARARTFGRRSPVWQTLLLTHSLFALALVIPLIMTWAALQSGESAAFEHRMATLVTSQTIELRPEIIERAKTYERTELRAWLSVALFVVLWLGSAAFALTRDQAKVARLLRSAATDDANRDRYIASAVTMAIEKKLLS